MANPCILWSLARHISPPAPRTSSAYPQPSATLKTSHLQAQLAFVPHLATKIQPTMVLAANTFTGPTLCRNHNSPAPRCPMPPSHQAANPLHIAPAICLAVQPTAHADNF